LGKIFAKTLFKSTILQYNNEFKTFGARCASPASGILQITICPPHTRDMVSLWPPPAAVAVVLTAFLAMNLCAPTVTVTITVMPVCSFKL
jgi:hypothetical protein